MPRPSALPAELAGAPFTVTATGAPGVTRQRSRASDLAVPFRGARVPRGTDDFMTLASALALLLRSDQVFSHTTAARIQRLPLPRAREHEWHITTVGGGRAPRRAGVSGHRAGERATAVVGALPVTAPVATWLDLGALLTLDELVVVGDALVRRQDPLATIEELGCALREFSGRGARRLIRAFELVRPRTDSPKETELRLLLVRAGLPEPIVNCPVRNEFGVLIAYGDLVWPDARLILEYEGAHHASDPRQFARDVERINELQALGWFVIRVDRALLQAHATLIGRVRAAFDRSR